MSSKRRRCLSFAAAALFLHTASAWAQTPEADGIVTLTAGMYAISAEIADRFDTRQHGLMGRTQMAAHEGMLFVFDQPARQCMWMKNTLLPLSVAFLDLDGRIVNIEDMEPQTLDSHCSRVPVRYALEMNRGWFAQRGLGEGTRIEGVAGRLAVN